MRTCTIHDVITSADRYKLYLLLCAADNLAEHIDATSNANIHVLDMGKELSTYLDTLDDYRYLNIDVYDFIKKLLDKHKSRITASGNEVIAIYNLGILLEPALKLNAVQLLKEFSKSAALIIIWENQLEIPDRLSWPTQKSKAFLDFSETQLKELQYEI